MTPLGTPSVSALLRRQFRCAHDLLDAAIDQLALETAERGVPGTPRSAGACYAQAVLSEDLSIHGVLAAGMPLALSTWAGRTGLSELPLLAAPTNWRDWASRVQLDLAAVRAYARAVYAATDAYLAIVPDDALDQARDETRPCILRAVLLTLAMRRGEIGRVSALDRQQAAGEARTGGGTAAGILARNASPKELP